MAQWEYKRVEYMMGGQSRQTEAMNHVANRSTKTKGVDPPQTLAAAEDEAPTE